MKSDPSNNSTWIIILVVFFFILIIGFGCWSTTSHFKQTFGNLMGNNIKDLEITMFMSPKCQWCVKTMEMLEKEGVKNQLEIIDITTPEGAKYAAKFGADKQPIPSFISKKNKTGAVGYRETVADIVDKLKPAQNSSNGPSPSPDNKEISELQIVMFAKEGCSWCEKAKKELEPIMSSIQVFDINTPEGQQLAANSLPPGNGGVPAFVSMVTKKHVIGYKPLDQLIQELR